MYKTGNKSKNFLSSYSQNVDMENQICFKKINFYVKQADITSTNSLKPSLSTLLNREIIIHNMFCLFINFTKNYGDVTKLP